MSQRERFEEWCDLTERDPTDLDLFAAFQYAEDQAFERAAIECDQLSRKQGTLGRIMAAQDCAEAIRALQREEGEK